VVLNDLFQTLEFVNGNLNGYRLLIFIKNNIGVKVERARPPKYKGLGDLATGALRLDDGIRPPPF
jgi:hypothetical protein